MTSWPLLLTNLANMTKMKASRTSSLPSPSLKKKAASLKATATEFSIWVRTLKAADFILKR